MAQPDLMVLLRALAADEADTVTTLLRDAPTLVTAAADVGATRQQSTQYWLADIEHYVYAGDTALHIAAASHRPAVVRTLLELGAGVDAMNRRKARPLHYAADGGPGSTHWHPEDQAEVIRLLVVAGADPNAFDLNGTSPLHRAVRSRCAAAVAALLAGGADPLLPNGHGTLPLQLATMATGRGGAGTPAAKEQQHEIVRLLRGAER